MKEMGIVAWKWIAVGAVMGLLTIMMMLGIGRKRGTWLHSLRLALWMVVVGGAGAAGCSEEEIRGTPDGSDTGPGEMTCYAAPAPDADTIDAPDTSDDPGLDETEFSCVECYAAPWDPPDDPSEPDATDVDDDEGDAEEEG